MICKHCTHSEYADTSRVWCHKHMSHQDRYGTCPHFEREPGSDDDKGEDNATE